MKKVTKAELAVLEGLVNRGALIVWRPGRRRSVVMVYDAVRDSVCRNGDGVQVRVE